MSRNLSFKRCSFGYSNLGFSNASRKWIGKHLELCAHSMSFTKHHSNLRLASRNEGKIKSYDSCCDVRAWSHDLSAQDRYLREWIKTDMRICVIPASTLASFLGTMTFRSRRRATPRCHPDCKSKVLLDRIGTSCKAVKECLQQDEKFEKYFVEEELESSHWPCDKCLEALKSIKMFWKIIIDKLFKINVSKYEEFKPSCKTTDSIKIAETWETEILQQANLIKNLSDSSKRDLSDTSRNKMGSCDSDHEDRRYISISRSFKIRPSDTKLLKKVSKSTSIGIENIDVGCDICSESDIKDDQVCRRIMKMLQDKCNSQSEEIERLRKDNSSLRDELDKRCYWTPPFCTPDNLDVDYQSTNAIPKPFESNVDENRRLKNIDSEMIITMKNGKNKSFKHVSLLQVLHKTNVPFLQNMNINKPCSKKEDPIEVLNKVQNTFGAIVRRELGIVSDKKYWPKKIEVDATFETNANGSRRSSSTLSSRLTSQSDFVSTNDLDDKPVIKVIDI